MEKNILEELKSYIIYKCVEDRLLTYRRDKSKQESNHAFRMKFDQFDES